jgi:hypothetical protein
MEVLAWILAAVLVVGSIAAVIYFCGQVHR